MPDRLHREWALVLVAAQALTRIPVTVAHEPGSLRRATRYMPLVGIGIGLAAAAAFALASAGLPPAAAAVLALATTLLLTGALHEDGLADSADGLFGGRARDDALRIMRDSRVGAFGVLALVAVLAAKLACLAALPNPGAALVAGHAASRFWAVLPPALLPYARPDGMAGGIAGPAPIDLAVAALCGLPPLLLLGPRAVPAFGLSALAALLFGLYVRRRLGGYTGDTLGATQQLTEAAILLAALWRAA